MTVLTLSRSLLWKKSGEKKEFFPLFLSPGNKRVEWEWILKGGHQQSSHHPFLKCCCDPVSCVFTPIAGKCAEWNSLFFKWAKASGVRNGNPDIVNVTGLPFMMFNQRLNIYRITFPTLAQWQLLHHPVLFPGNIYLEKPPWGQV